MLDLAFFSINLNLRYLFGSQTVCWVKAVGLVCVREISNITLTLQIGSTFLSNTMFTMTWMTDDALGRPYIITRYSQFSEEVMKFFFHLFLSHMWL